MLSFAARHRRDDGQEIRRENVLKSKLTNNDACLNEFVQDVVKQYLDDMGTTPPDNLYQVILNEVERPLIQTVLDHAGGNQSRAAGILGITRATLRNRIRRYQLD